MNRHKSDKSKIGLTFRYSYLGANQAAKTRRFTRGGGEGHEQKRTRSIRLGHY